jgi:hypothetical protein
MFSLIGSMWGWLGLLQVVETAVYGERAIQSTAYRCRRMAVMWARIATAWLLFWLIMAWLK